MRQSHHSLSSLVEGHHMTMALKPVRHSVAFFLVAVLVVSNPSPVQALSPPAPRPPANYKSASAIPSPPPEDDPFCPSLVDNALVAAFRWTLQQQSGERSSVPGFDGMVEELIDYRCKNGPDELERVSYQTMVALSGPVPFIYKSLFASMDATPAVLAWFAKYLLPFLVGDMTLTQRATDDPRAGGVLVERCRVLEGSGCKGICAKMCKVPTERFFKEQWGVPLTMTPNFETGQCQLTFGLEPTPIENDPTIPPGCLTRCPASSFNEGNSPADLC